MGLKLDKGITTKTGIECKYYIISKVEKDKISQSAYIVFYGYPSKKQRDMGYEFLDRRYLNIYPKDYEQVFGVEKISEKDMNDVKSIYQFAKENLEEFKDANEY
jgi:hypothetical protein